MLILGKSVIQEKNFGFNNTFFEKNKRIIVADLTKKSEENISKALIQVGLVTIKVFGKICMYKITLVDNKVNTIFEDHLVS